MGGLSLEAGISSEGMPQEQKCLRILWVVARDRVGTMETLDVATEGSKERTSELENIGGPGHERRHSLHEAAPAPEGVGVAGAQHDSLRVGHFSAKTSWKRLGLRTFLQQTAVYKDWRLELQTQFEARSKCPAIPKDPPFPWSSKEFPEHNATASKAIGRFWM